MSVLMANYRVRDFDVFKTVFDEFEPVRAEYGVTDRRVLRDPDDPTKVVVMLGLPSADAARRFSREPRRAEALARAGVVASHDTILEQVES
jgi:hypothetical protein